MKIDGKEAKNLNQLLEQAIQQGDRYVSLDTGKENQSLRAQSMAFFIEKSDAEHYNHLKWMVYQDHFKALPILPLQQQLQRNIDLQQTTNNPGKDVTDITIDTGHIFFQERARLDIFTREIAKQLRDQDVKPDLAQLIENIRDDNRHFDIAGTRRVDGVDKPYVISIEQNENRNFLIGRVEPRQPQQQIAMYMQSEVLEGKVRKEDALEIKNMLHQEKENGNRFVSFPAEWNGLKKDDFTAFKAAFSALEHAYENTTDRDRHIVRSISVVEKEINYLLENNKEQAKPLEIDRDEKRSRGQELSR